MIKYDYAVIFGGKSCENEISVITGTMVVNVLKKENKSVLPLFISQQGQLFCGDELANINNFASDKIFKSRGKKSWQSALFCQGGIALLKPNGKIKEQIKIGCLINCCHGGGEEGGTVAGVCAFYKIPLLGSGLFSSSTCLNKYFTKLILRALKVKTAPWQLVKEISEVAPSIKKLGLPVVVKPRNLGSSIGVVLAKTQRECELAVESALVLDDGAILEKYLPNRREINCAVFFNGEEAVCSNCEEVFSSGELLSYDDKYSGNGKSVFPAKIEEDTAQKIKDITKKVFCALEMRGIARFDYIISQNQIYLCEINAVPGSLSHYLLTENLAKFSVFLQKLCAVAVQEFNALNKKSVIKTGILNNVNANACKIK